MRILLILLVMVPSSLSTSIRTTPLRPPPPESYKVKVSMYRARPEETNGDPFTTASGFKIDSSNPKAHRIIAVSRDLKALFKYGTKVMVEDIGEWSGVYVIRDLMNARFTRKIDILINTTDKPISFHSATLTPIQE